MPPTWTDSEPVPGSSGSVGRTTPPATGGPRMPIEGAGPQPAHRVRWPFQHRWTFALDSEDGHVARAVQAQRHQAATMAGALLPSGEMVASDAMVSADAATSHCIRWPLAAMTPRG